MAEMSLVITQITTITTTTTATYTLYGGSIYRPYAMPLHDQQSSFVNVFVSD